MSKISEAKKQVRLKEWSEMYLSYQESGERVAAWCEKESISVKTFYYRLRKIRESALLTQEQHEIIPVQQNSVSTQCIPEPKQTQPIVISGNGIVAELPAGISPETLTAVIRGLRQC